MDKGNQVDRWKMWRVRIHDTNTGNLMVELVDNCWLSVEDIIILVNLTYIRTSNKYCQWLPMQHEHFYLTWDTWWTPTLLRLAWNFDKLLKHVLSFIIYFITLDPYRTIFYLPKSCSSYTLYVGTCIYFHLCIKDYILVEKVCWKLGNI